MVVAIIVAEGGTNPRGVREGYSGFFALVGVECEDPAEGDRPWGRAVLREERFFSGWRDDMKGDHEGPGGLPTTERIATVGGAVADAMAQGKRGA